MTGATQHDVAAVLYGATVTLSDSSAPTLSGISGSLFAGGYLTSTKSATYTASDNVGIRSARLYVDDFGRPATTYACDYTYAIPCTDKSGATLHLDTGTLADGQHTIRIAASDPASNEAKSSAQTVTVDNGAPSGPEQLAVDGGESHSANGFAVGWANPSGQVAPIATAHWRLCDAQGVNCSTGSADSPGVSRLDGLTVPAEGDWQLAVWLEDAAGNTDPGSAASTWLRYHVPTASPPPESGRSGEPAPPPAGSDPAPSSDPGTVLLRDGGSLGRISAGLHITSATFRQGRLVIRGRTTTTALGWLTVRYRLGRQIVRVRRHVSGGPFRLVVKARRAPRRIDVQFPGSLVFLPVTVSRTVRS